jgi:EmrB/QacA subfamily drug resistance transporter
MDAMLPASDLTPADVAATVAYATPRGRWVLLATVAGSGMASLDATVVGIALPRIGIGFHAGLATLQWVVTGYTLTLAALLLLGGALGDRYGRRRVFQIGVVWFALASLGCAAAPDAVTLIAARALQGVGAALLTPGSLAILQASFAPRDRARAIGAWSGLSGLATAAGPLVGGVLLAVASWRWLFLLNLPLAATVLVVSARHVPESADPGASGRVDLAGAVLAVVSLGGLTAGLVEGPVRGWSDPLILALLAAAVAGAAGFVAVERTARNPMLPAAVLRLRVFGVTNAVTLLLYGALGAALFLLPVALEQVAGYSPLQAGASLLPVTLLMLALSARSGRLAARIGPRRQMTAGPLLVGAGLWLLSRLSTDHSYLTGVAPGVLALGAGLVLTVAPLTATAMGAVPGEHSGLASAVNNDVARTGALLAVAVVPVASSLGGSAYLHPQVFATGFRTAVGICALLCVAAAALARLLLPRGAPGVGHDEQSETTKRHDQDRHGQG